MKDSLRAFWYRFTSEGLKISSLESRKRNHGLRQSCERHLSRFKHLPLRISVPGLCINLSQISCFKVLGKHQNRSFPKDHQADLVKKPECCKLNFWFPLLKVWLQSDVSLGSVRAPLGEILSASSNRFPFFPSTSGFPLTKQLISCLFFLCSMQLPGNPGLLCPSTLDQLWILSIQCTVTVSTVVQLRTTKGERVFPPYPAEPIWTVTKSRENFSGNHQHWRCLGCGLLQWKQNRLQTKGFSKVGQWPGPGKILKVQWTKDNRPLAYIWLHMCVFLHENCN